MPITVGAVYENGVLRPTRPLPLKEQEVVRITIEPEFTWAERTAGLLPWKGDPELLQRIAEGDEFSILELDMTFAQIPAGAETEGGFEKQADG